MSDVAARREARRRRILENSESRLRKITSLQQERTEEDNSKPNLNSVEPIRHDSHSYPRENEEYSFVSSVNTNIYNEQKECFVTPPYVKENKSHEKIIDAPTKTVISDFRIWIIINIAILTNFLCLLCTNLNLLRTVDFKFMYMNKIFVPFLTYKIIDLIVIKFYVKENIFLNTLLLLSNIPPRLSQILIKFGNIFMGVMQDMFLYLFVFIMVEACLSFCGYN